MKKSNIVSLHMPLTAETKGMFGVREFKLMPRGSFDVPGWFAASPGVFRNVGTVLLDDARVEAPIERGGPEHVIEEGEPEEAA